MNFVCMLGRVVADPTIRMAGDKKVASFSIAVDRDYKDADGEYPTDFFDCVCWRSGADYAEKYVTKGRLILVTGKGKTSKWKDKDTGKNRVSVFIDVVKIEFMDRKNGNPTTTGSMPEYEPEAYKADFGDADVTPLSKEEENQLPF